MCLALLYYAAVPSAGTVREYKVLHISQIQSPAHKSTPLYHDQPRIRVHLLSLCQSAAASDCGSKSPVRVRGESESAQAVGPGKSESA